MNVLSQIIDLLKKNNAPVVKLIQDGLSKNEIWRILSEKNLEPTTEIEQLYRLLNGTRPTDDVIGAQYFFPGHIMCSLEKSIELYEEECLEYESWPEGYIPIFWNGNRDYLLVDCLNKNEGV